MPVQRNRFFVVTGGPGSGKTSLIRKLREKSVPCVDEAGRKIIQVQIHIGGRALPWIDPQLYAELMIQDDVFNYLAADPGGVTVFDRGIVDGVGYAELTGFPVPFHLRTAVARCRYNRTVFAAPPWEAIYVRDAERRQDFAESIRTYDALARAYRAAGYDLLELPLAGVEERAEFVLAKINASPDDGG